MYWTYFKIYSSIHFGLSKKSTRELLIQLYDGGLSGNLQKGLRKPKSIPLLCCNFTVKNLQRCAIETVSINMWIGFCILRYSSRALILPFQKPTVGPKTQAEMMQFQHLMGILEETSSAVGWAISVGKLLKEEHFHIQPRVRAKLVGVDPRLCTGYATLLFCVEKVLLL